MATRAFKTYTVTSTGVPQPVIGTTTTSAITATGTSAQGQGATYVTIPVTDSSMFAIGDYAAIDNNSNTTTHVRERCRVMAVPNSTHITVEQLAYNHLSGCYVALGKAISVIYLQCLNGNAAALTLGTCGMNLTGNVNVIGAVGPSSLAGPPYDFTWPPGGGLNLNGVDTSDFWITGTTGDGWLVSFYSL